jgi:N-acetylneuraminic acid mutarotase
MKRRDFLVNLAVRSLTSLSIARASREMADETQIQIDWRPGPPIPTSIGGHVCADLHNRIIIAGGTNWVGEKRVWLAKNYSYDPRVHKWSELTELSRPVAYAAGVGTGEGLYVIGGTDGKFNYCEVSQFVRTKGRGTWRPSHPLPEARVYAGGAFAEGSIYVVGGTLAGSDLSTTTRTVLSYRPNDRQANWSYLAPIPGDDRCLFPAASCGGKIYIFGGCKVDEKGKRVNLADAYCYSPKQDRWTRIGDLPQHGRALASATYLDRYIFLCGGYTATDEQAIREEPTFGFSNEVIVYDTRNDRYLSASPMPIRVMDAEAVFVGKTLYVMGGEDRGRHRTDVLAIGLVSL